MSVDRTSLPGRRVVLYMYVSAVLVAGGFGYVLGLAVFENAAEKGIVASFGPVTFSLTPINLALYGVVTVGLLLGVLLGAVAYVARRDDAAAAAVEPRR